MHTYSTHRTHNYRAHPRFPHRTRTATSTRRAPQMDFKAVNTDTDKQRRDTARERQTLTALYAAALISGDITSFLAYKLECEPNRAFFAGARANLLCNFIASHPLSDSIAKATEWGLAETRRPLFALAERCLEAREPVRARKLLNLARERGWLCNELYELEDALEGAERPTVPVVRLKE